MKVHHRKQENDTSLNTGFSYIALRYITDVKWGVHGPCLVALEPGISHPHSVNLTSRPLSQLVFIYFHKFSIQAVLIDCVKCIQGGGRGVQKAIKSEYILNGSPLTPPCLPIWAVWCGSNLLLLSPALLWHNL